jgi:hypothetical protein
MGQFGLGVIASAPEQYDATATISISNWGDAVREIIKTRTTRSEEVGAVLKFLGQFAKRSFAIRPKLVIRTLMQLIWWAKQATACSQAVEK